MKEGPRVILPLFHWGRRLKGSLSGLVWFGFLLLLLCFCFLIFFFFSGGHIQYTETGHNDLKLFVSASVAPTKLGVLGKIPELYSSLQP